MAESSSDQVIEQVRRRANASFVEPASTAAQQPAPQEAPPATQATSSPAKKAAKKKAASEPSTPAPDKGFYENRVRDYAQQSSSGRASWVRAFGDVNRHSNLSPGQDENPDRTEVSGGGMVGMDWTRRYAANSAFQIGVFGGGTASRANYSDTTFQLTEDPSLGDPTDTYRRTGHSQDIDGGFVGGYLAYRRDTWLSTLVVKTDFLNLSDESTLTQMGCMGTGDRGVQSGNASLTTYLVGGDLTNRIPQDAHSWIGPTVGFRYTATDYGSDTSVAQFDASGAQVGTLGLHDGQALRLQGGVRFGDRWKSDGAVWETDVGLLAYSDVWVSGFTYTSTSGGVVTPVDEGKVRGLLQAIAKVDVGGGTSYLLQGEFYGGEDLIGASGQLGVRYEW